MVQQHTPVDDEKLLEEIEDVDLDILFMSYAQHLVDEKDVSVAHICWRNTIWAIRSLGGTLKLAKKFSSLNVKYYNEKGCRGNFGVQLYTSNSQ